MPEGTELSPEEMELLVSPTDCPRRRIQLELGRYLTAFNISFQNTQQASHQGRKVLKESASTTKVPY